jgi:hypothetical protein
VMTPRTGRSAMVPLTLTLFRWERGPRYGFVGLSFTIMYLVLPQLGTGSV